MANETSIAAKQLVLDLEKYYAQWESIKEFGGYDPFYEDGINMNLTRNHIIYAKNELLKMHESGELDVLPEIYHRDLPPEVDLKYMARADEIRKNAMESLRKYKMDENYIYIQSNSGLIGYKQAESICLGNVIGYVTGLQESIAKDDLVTMRRHEYPDRYLKSFRVCRERMEKLMKEKKQEKVGQMDIFDFL